MLRFLSLAVLTALIFPVAVAGQEPIAAARELYAAAAYEDALELLRRAPASGASFAGTEGDLLRAFCLLALQREDEAKAVIADVITERPMYVPSEDEASPRIRTAFRQVRQKLLPDVIRGLYQSARESYERKEHLAAAAKFGDLVKLLGDPDVQGDPTLTDLRLLADGFRTVSEAAADTIATAANVSPMPSVGTMGNGVESGVPAGGTSGREAASEVPGTEAPRFVPVTPPIAINQQLPPWRADPINARLDYTGAIELVIDEQGLVENVSLRESVHPIYDSELLRVARTWTYQPARRGDQPVKFHKTLVVKLNSR
jgi:TonB family protein